MWPHTELRHRWEWEERKREGKNRKEAKQPPTLPPAATRPGHRKGTAWYNRRPAADTSVTDDDSSPRAVGYHAPQPRRLYRQHHAGKELHSHVRVTQFTGNSWTCFPGRSLDLFLRLNSFFFSCCSLAVPSSPVRRGPKADGTRVVSDEWAWQMFWCLTWDVLDLKFFPFFMSSEQSCDMSMGSCFQDAKVMKFCFPLLSFTSPSRKISSTFLWPLPKKEIDSYAQTSSFSGSCGTGTLNTPYVCWVGWMVSRLIVHPAAHCFLERATKVLWYLV